MHIYIPLLRRRKGLVGLYFIPNVFGALFLKTVAAFLLLNPLSISRPSPPVNMFPSLHSIVPANGGRKKIFILWTSKLI